MKEQNMKFVKIYAKDRCKAVKILDRCCLIIRQFNMSCINLIN